MKKIFLGLWILAALLFCACSEASRTDTANSSAVPNAPKNMADAPQEELSVLPDEGGGGKKDISLNDAAQSKDKSVSVTERKIIRNAVLRLESSTPQDTQKKVIAIAYSNGGFLLESNTSTAGDQVRNQNTFSVTLQVPSAKFESALEEIRKTGARVLSENVKGQDVTEEFIDVEARLKTKKALEERFLEIMKRANSVKEALEVERELEKVRSEVERIEGRKRSLENLTGLSKVTVNVIPPSAISASSTGFWYQLKEAVNDGFEAALTSVLVLVRVLIALIPFLLIVVMPVFLLLRYVWRKYKQNRMARAAAAEIEKLSEDVE